MANEAVLVQDLEYRQLEVTMADGSLGTDIEQYTILKLSDANTGSASSTDGDLFLGILAVENKGADGQTRYAAYRGGVWDLKDSGAGMAVGVMCKIAGANLVATADAAPHENHTNTRPICSLYIKHRWNISIYRLPKLFRPSQII